MSSKHVWVVVLAAGEGLRLRQAEPYGPDSRTPKQYRRLDGQESMLRWTLRRASAVTARSRIVVVVAPEHQLWWRSQLADLPRDNIVVQPRNRGTAIGILLPLMLVLSRDPDAEVLVLPSDHHVEREEVMCRVLRRALQLARQQSSRIVLVGVRPERDLMDYGWILPDCPLDEVSAGQVAEFREKPGRQAIGKLLARGAVVNSLMVAGRGHTLKRLIAEEAPEVPEQMTRCLVDQKTFATGCLDRVYDDIASTDFSRDVLESRPDRLLVQPAADECGWSDLGTPERLRHYFAAHASVAAARHSPVIHSH